MNRAFGELLREMREAAGMTVNALAQAIGMSMTALSDVERGKRPPLPPARILDACRTLGTDPVLLLVAAARHTGAFALEYREDDDDVVAAALSAAWGYMTAAELATLERAARRAMARGRK